MPKAPNRRVCPTHDWAVVKRDYVEGWQNGEGRHQPTLEELGEKWGIPTTSVRRRASMEDWSGARDAFDAKVTRQREKKASELLAHYAVTFDRRVLTVAERLVELIARSLAPYEAPEIGPPRAPPDSLILRRLAGALKNAHEVAQRALGKAPGLEFEDERPGVQRGRVLFHMVPKPPPTTTDADED